VEQPAHRRFVDANDPRVFDGRLCSQIHRLPGEATFSEKATATQYPNDGFFPLRRHHRQLDFARLDVEYGIGCIPLREEHLLLRARQRRVAIADLLEKVLRMKRRHRCDSHGSHISV